MPLRGSLQEIAAGLRSGEFTAVSLWEQASVRHADLGEQMNAYLTWDPEAAHKRALAADAAFAAGVDLGPLQGLPTSIKDLYGIQGLPTYAGSSMRLPEKWEREGPVVKAIKRQLATITGKTHTVEFAAGGIGDNCHWGAPRNPWDAERPRGPGGSSSGAGVSLWEGSAVVAFGSDTMGSVRIPASMTAVVGLKITMGRWSNEGIVPLRAVQDTPGPLARTVEDAGYVFAALDPAHAPDPAPFLELLAGTGMAGVTLGIADDCYWEGCAPGIEDTVRAGLSELEAAGARLVDAPSPEAAELLEVVMSGGLPNSELAGFLDHELPTWVEQLDPALAGRMEGSRNFLATEHLEKEKWLAGLAGSAPRNFDSVDVIVSPTLPITPPVLIDGRPESDPTNRPPVVGARNTCPANFFRQCAISLPAGLDAQGMPVGLQLTAPGGAEEKLLEIAVAAERVLGTNIQRLGTPPLLAA